MKKNIIFVNSLFQLLSALQIRRAMYPEERFDIVLSDGAYGLHEIYLSKSLEDIFDKVYFADVKEKYVLDGQWGLKKACKRKINSARLLFFPGKLFEHILDAQIEFEYTDVFFWNPDVVFYSFYMESNRRECSIRLHVYQDGVANYYLEAPDSDIQGGVKLFGIRAANSFLNRRYGFDCIYNMDFDHYLFEPAWYVAENEHSLVEIPKLEKNDETYNILNSIFRMEQIQEIQEKYIFFDHAYGKDEIDLDLYFEVIDKITNYVGAENFAIKLHPRTNSKFFDSMNVHVITDRYPWELYSLKYNLSSKVLITVMSASVVTSDAIFIHEGDNKKVLLFNIVKPHELEAAEGVKTFLSARAAENSVLIPNSGEELEKAL